MSEEGFFYGCIVGFGRTPYPAQYYTLNKLAIDALPDEDQWPPLTKGMFSVPPKDAQQGFGHAVGVAYPHHADRT